MPLFRRRRPPWWTRPLMLLGVLAGLYHAERKAPLITEPVDLPWLIRQGRLLAKKVRERQER